MDIVDINLIDASGNTLEYDFEKQSGVFKLLGICNEGGKRLFNPNGKAINMMIISPNPSDNNVNIELYLIEKGNTLLRVYSVGGQLYDEFDLSNQTGNINLKLNTAKYSNGLYFIQLQTPTIIKREKLMIMK